MITVKCSKKIPLYGHGCANNLPIKDSPFAKPQGISCRTEKQWGISCANRQVYKYDMCTHWWPTGRPWGRHWSPTRSLPRCLWLPPSCTRQRWLWAEDNFSGRGWHWSRPRPYPTDPPQPGGQKISTHCRLIYVTKCVLTSNEIHVHAVVPTKCVRNSAMTLVQMDLSRNEAAFLLTFSFFQITSELGLGL